MIEAVQKFSGQLQSLLILYSKNKNLYRVFTRFLSHILNDNLDDQHDCHNP